MIDLISLTLAQARDALRKKDCSATELVEAYLAALEKARALNAFVLEAPEHAHAMARGPYRFLRHPNYAVVTGEIAAVPLALGLPIFALVFSLLNAAVLAIRISAENAALGALASDRPR